MSNFTTISYVSGGIPGTAPGVFACSTPDDLATITTAGYMNDVNDKFKQNDILWINYDDTSTFPLYPDGLVATMGQFYVNVSGANSSLIAFPSGLGTASGKDASDNGEPTVASVSGATVINDILVAADIAGTVKDGGAVTAAAGHLQAGFSGQAGTLNSFPATAANGKLIISALNAGGAFNTTIRNSAMGQSTVYSIPDAGQATGSILVSKVVADPGANLISFDVTVGQAALAAGGAVALVTSSGAKQYKVRALWLNSGGTNFSGGGGDRLLAISDGTTVYSVVPATDLQTLVNAGWGMSTPLPFPAAAAINTSTVAGQNLRALYSGGTTDYTAGSVVISGIVERVA